MASPPAFRLLGFPVQVKPGFLLLMVLVIVVNGPELGVWLALFIALFTLLHELGHAVAARATGAKAEISLDFLYGYASFTPTRELKRWEQAGISLAGPATQIIISLVALRATGATGLVADRSWSSAQLGLWWAGPVIGLVNLIPVLPFDGGNIAQAGLDAVLPRGMAKVVMIYLSIGVTVGGAVLLFTLPRLHSLGIFAMVPLIAQLQMLGQHRHRSHRPEMDSASLFAAGEAAAWRDGDVDRFVGGQLPSPWYRAHQQLCQGHPEVARQVLLVDFTDPETPNWWPPDAAPEMSLDALVRLLPDPLPTGRTYSEFVLASVLLRLGSFERAANYAAAAYRREPSPMLAVCVSRAAAALGDRPVALGWLRAAIGDGPATDGLRHAADHAPEFDDLRHDHEFQSLTH
ncbi:MAG: peptidase family protein [Ilumatobacteraceae bacterium]|nr:peptidase family protein [Ilumatobacteraceae bacterium]